MTIVPVCDPRHGGRSAGGMQLQTWAALFVCLLSLVLAGSANAQQTDDPACRQAERNARACHAQTVSGLATRSNTKHYGWYYVGGGTLFRGDRPSPQEGTFGWDYRGFILPKLVQLGWSHGRRYQGGGGAYRTVGPAPHRTQ